jgi:hypothetical protein
MEQPRTVSSDNSVVSGVETSGFTTRGLDN